MYDCDISHDNARFEAIPYNVFCHKVHGRCLELPSSSVVINPPFAQHCRHVYFNVTFSEYA